MSPVTKQSARRVRVRGQPAPTLAVILSETIPSHEHVQDEAFPLSRLHGHFDQRRPLRGPQPRSEPELRASPPSSRWTRRSARPPACSASSKASYSGRCRIAIRADWSRSGITNREKGLKHEPISPGDVPRLSRALVQMFADAAAWWRPQLNLADETGDPISRLGGRDTPKTCSTCSEFSPRSVASFTRSPGSLRSGARGDHQPPALADALRWRPGSHRPSDLWLNGSRIQRSASMPAGFGFPGETDLWQQLQWNLHYHSRGAHFMESVARLTPGVTTERANRELAALGVEARRTSSAERTPG